MVEGDAAAMLGKGLQGLGGGVVGVAQAGRLDKEGGAGGEAVAELVQDGLSGLWRPQSIKKRSTCPIRWLGAGVV